MIEVDVIEVEDTIVIAVELPATLAEAADGCVPAWLVAMIVAALAGRELARWHRHTSRR